jgi:hypothetical protein
MLEISSEYSILSLRPPKFLMSFVNKALKNKYNKYKQYKQLSIQKVDNQTTSAKQQSSSKQLN